MPDAHAQHHYTPSELEKIKQCEFAQGVAYAVARLLRDFDRVVEAKEIWRDSGCSLDGVDPYMERAMNNLAEAVQKTASIAAAVFSYLAALAWVAWLVGGWELSPTGQLAAAMTGWAVVAFLFSLVAGKLRVRGPK